MYQTLTTKTQTTYEEKRSEFIAFIWPAKDRPEALSYLEQARKEHPNARHHCWAYLIGNPTQPKTVAFSDDGEPSGTAGKPMLHVLTQRGAGDCCAVVVRYFGGIKLGAAGLVRAYGQAVSKALDAAEWVDVVQYECCRIITTYEDEPHIRHYIDLHQGQIHTQNYTEKVTLGIEIPKSQTALFKQEIIRKTAGRVTLSLL